MQQTKWLLAALLIIMVLPAPVLAAEVKGFIEAGAAGVSIKDSQLRVNEYSVIKEDDGATAYTKAKIEAHDDNGMYLDVDAEFMGNRDQQYELELDAMRYFRVNSSYDTFLHWLDHDQLNYLDAAVRPPVGPVGATVPLNPNSIPGFFVEGSYDPTAGTVVVGGNNPASQQIGRASLYGEDLVPNKDFSIIYREWENNADVVIPDMPNITIHAGYRMQQREGWEQSIGMSKCTSCHITGEGRKVDEETQDLSIGATGKFGQFTVDYTFTDRSFDENANNPTRWYDPALSPGGGYSVANNVFDNRILYDYDQPGVTQRDYDTTPDSDKQSHVLKGRYDFSGTTNLVGSFVNASVDSKKYDEVGVYSLGDNRLETDYDGYSFRFATKPLDNLKLSLRGKYESIDSDEVSVTFYPNGTIAQPNLGGGALPSSITNNYGTIISRDILTLGTDAFYRLDNKSSIRAGYQYQNIDRDDKHYEDTDIHTVKLAYKTRLTDDLKARASYTYELTKDPFQNTDAAGYIDPATGLPYSTVADPRIGTGALYGTAFYDQRTADLSNQPEDTHEVKTALTWAPRANFSTTFSYRFRYDKNELDRSEWKQTTHSPALSAWYAPTEKLNLTFAYNYMGQSTEAKFCQGWYDG